LRLALAGLVLAGLLGAAPDRPAGADPARGEGTGAQADTWHTQVADANGGAGVSLALDAAGRPHLGYGGHLEGIYIFGLKYAAYDGSAWQDEMVDPDVSPGWEASLALDAAGNPHIAYHDAHEALKYARRDASGWHIQVVDAGGDVGEQAAMRLDAAGRPCIAYWDQTHRAVKYARHTGAAWSIQVVATMAGGQQSSSLSLALDAAGRPHLCYYDDSVKTLKYAYHDGSAWRFEAIEDDIFYNGQECSIALDAQGRAHVGFRDLELKDAYRGAGGRWGTATVDDDFFAGDNLSLALDPAGRPHLAYTDWPVPQEELRYAYFNGVRWRAETVDTAAPTSRYEDVWLVVDGEGRLHIGYWDLGPDDVKYAVKGPSPLYHGVYMPLVLR
jgi:hypothetical protein